MYSNFIIFNLNRNLLLFCKSFRLLADSQKKSEVERLDVCGSLVFSKSIHICI